MPMNLPTNLDEYQLHLFSPKDEMERQRLPQELQGRLLRLRALYTFWLNFPSKTTREMVDQSMQQHPGLSRSTAYEDVKLVKVLMGNLEQESKEWQRHVFNQRTEEVYRAAMRSKDLKTAERANADYAKFNRLDRDDEERLDWSQIVPHVIEPTDDPTVIGIAPVKGLRDKIRKLRRRFSADIQDADFVEMDKEDDGTEKAKDISQ